MYRDGVLRMTLPYRDAPALRRSGIALIIGGTLFLTFMCFWSSGPWRSAFPDRPGDHIHWIPALFLCFSLPGFAAGLAFAYAGVVLLLGRSRAEIAITPTHIEAIERAYPFRWKRQQLRRVEHRVAVSVMDGNTSSKDVLNDESLCGLYVESAAAPWIITMGYARSVLLDVARVLADHLGQRDQISIEEKIGEAPERLALVSPEMPRGCNAIVGTNRNELRIVFPPLGLSKGSRGFIQFSVFWILLSSGGTATFAFHMPSGDANRPLVFTAFAIFNLVGLVFLALSIHLGRRSTEFQGDRHALAIRETSPVRKRAYRISPSELATITLAPTGVAVNDNPTYKLRIALKRGKPVDLLAGRDEAELLWIAGLLQRHYLPRRDHA